jgi:hypothetical protein
MNKLDLHPTSLTYAAHSNAGLGSIRRLTVLVPKDMDTGAATRRVWDLANDIGIYHVQLLGLCKEPAEEPELRRGLVAITSLLQDGGIFVEAHVDIGTSWVDTVKFHWLAGDMLVCCAEQRTGLLHRPLSQILQSDMDVPLYILTGLYAQNDSRSNWPAQAAAWMGSIAIIAGFFVLQTKISLLTDWAQPTLMLLSTGVEVWTVLIWNRLFE